MSGDGGMTLGTVVGRAQLGKLGTGVANSFIAGHHCPLLRKQSGHDNSDWIPHRARLTSNLPSSLPLAFWVLPG